MDFWSDVIFVLISISEDINSGTECNYVTDKENIFNRND